MPLAQSTERMPLSSRRDVSQIYACIPNLLIQLLSSSPIGGHLCYLPVVNRLSFYLAHTNFDIMVTILPIFGLFLIPLSIRYIFNPPRSHPLVGIPTESIFLISAYLLLKHPIASSVVFGTRNASSNLELCSLKRVCPLESLPHAVQIESIVALFLAGDALFKALLYIGVDPQSQGVKIALPLFKVLIIHARIFGGPLMGLARSLLSMQEVFLNCAGRFGRDLCGLGDEGENDIDLESQTHNVSRHFPFITGPCYTVIDYSSSRTYQHHPEFQMKI